MDEEREEGEGESGRGGVERGRRQSEIYRDRAEREIDRERGKRERDR